MSLIFALYHRRIKDCQIEIEYIKQEKRLVLISEIEFDVLLKNLIALYIPSKERRLINRGKRFCFNRLKSYYEYDQVEENLVFDMIQCLETIYKVEKIC